MQLSLRFEGEGLNIFAVAPALNCWSCYRFIIGFVWACKVLKKSKVKICYLSFFNLRNLAFLQKEVFWNHHLRENLNWNFLELLPGMLITWAWGMFSLPDSYEGIPELRRRNERKSALNTLKNILSEQTNSNGDSLVWCCSRSWRVSISYSVTLLMCLIFFSSCLFFFFFFLPEPCSICDFC